MVTLLGTDTKMSNVGLKFPPGDHGYEGESHFYMRSRVTIYLFLTGKNRKDSYLAC